MYTRRHLGSGLTALTAALITRSVPAYAADQTLRFASIGIAASASYRAELEPIARGIEADSGGRLEVALKPTGGYGKPGELMQLLEHGDIEMMNSVLGYYPGRFPQTSVIELPMMFDDAVTGTKALKALQKEGLLDKDFAAIKVLSLYVLSPYSIFTTGKKIATVRDFRGLRVRTPSPTMGLPLARLGAIPLGIPGSMVSDAISGGIIDAMAYGADIAMASTNAEGKSLADQMSVFLDLRFGAPALMTAINRATWDALPEDLRGIIEKRCAAQEVELAHTHDLAAAKAKQTLQADKRYTYIAPSPEFRAELEHAMTPSFDDWKAGMGRLGLDGEKLLTRTRELVRQFKVAGN